jgi:hypothetical protein
VTIEMSPYSATLTVNGKKRKQGTLAVRPGIIKATASKKGFGTQTKSVSAIAGQTAYIGFPLISTDESTVTWYGTHKKDQSWFEHIVGKANIAEGETVLQQLPLAKELPYIGPGLTYRIDYGEPLPGTSTPGVYITAPTEEGHQNALAWLTRNGYNPSGLHIKYIQAAL